MRHIVKSRWFFKRLSHYRVIVAFILFILIFLLVPTASVIKRFLLVRQVTFHHNRHVGDLSGHTVLQLFYRP
jgi:hypothetical protein